MIDSKQCMEEAPKAAAQDRNPWPGVPLIARIDSDSYFENMNVRVRRSMSDFGNVRQRLRVEIDEAATQNEFARLANYILALSFETCRVVPVGKLETLGDFLDGAEYLSAGVDADGAADASLGGLRTFISTADEQRAANSILVANLASLQWGHDIVVHAIQLLTHGVFGLYRRKSADPRAVTKLFTADELDADIPAKTMELIRGLPDKLQGWCSFDKAVLLYSLVRKYRPEKVVEIGIFGGRSIVPIALALRDNKAGHVVGIESWAAEASVAAENAVENDIWWLTTDYVGIKRAFFSYMVEQELHPYIRILETTSARGLATLDIIPFAHIDGGHSPVGAAQDVTAVLARMPSGGVIVLDDVEWPSTRAAVEILMDTCRLLQVTGNAAQRDLPSCAAFEKL